MEAVVTYLESVSIVTFWQLLILFVPLLILSFLVHFTSSAIEREGIRTFGIHIYLYLFAWLGTICHESGHALFCIIFRHKIKEIKFFSLGSGDGTLGYVNHTYESKSIYQSTGNFFIGIGPILLGTVVVYLSALLLLNISFSNSEDLVTCIQKCFMESFSDSSTLRLKFAAKELYNSFAASIDHQSWQFYLFLYIAFSIGSSITLSWTDIKGAWAGLLVIVIMAFLINLATFWYKTPTGDAYQIVAPVLTVFYSILLFTIILNSIAALILITTSTVKGFFWSR